MRLWSKSLTKWDAEKRAIVLDRKNCHWSLRRIGVPSVAKTNKGLALFYDALASDTIWPVVVAVQLDV